MAPRKRKETPKVEVKEEESEEYGRIVPEAALRIINRLDEQGKRLIEFSIAAHVQCIVSLLQICMLTACNSIAAIWW